MRILGIDWHTVPTSITMIIINPKPFTYPTNPTAVAVIRIMPRSVIVEFTNGAKVMGERTMTRTTGGGHRLINITAMNAGYKLSGMTIDFMCFMFVMTTTTGVVFTTTRCLDPTPSLVVLTPRACTLAREHTGRRFPVRLAVRVPADTTVIVIAGVVLALLVVILLLVVVVVVRCGGRRGRGSGHSVVVG